MEIFARLSNMLVAEEFAMLKATTSTNCVARDDRRSIAEHGTLNLSERDQASFFEAMIRPFRPNERLARALADHGRCVGTQVRP